jgi:hypothetical protein
MLRIALVIDTLTIHGGVRRCIELANALISRGHWVRIYETNGKYEKWLPCLAEIHPWSALKADGADVAVSFGSGPSALAATEAAQPRVKALYMVSLNERNLDALQRDPIMKTFRNPDWLLFGCSSWIVDWLARTNEREVYPLIGAVNRSIFHPVKVKRDNERPALLSSGDPREREGSVCVRKAFELAQKRVPGLSMEVYHKKGYAQAKMAEVYCRAHVFVDGQQYAGWNNPVAEAMACGRPVVCTDIGGVRDFAVNEETALLVPVEDVGAMADAIVRLLVDYDLAQRLRVLALERIERWTYARMAEDFERVVLERLE